MACSCRPRSSHSEKTTLGTAYGSIYHQRCIILLYCSANLPNRLSKVYWLSSLSLFWLAFSAIKGNDFIQFINGVIDLYSLHALLFCLACVITWVIFCKSGSGNRVYLVKISASSLTHIAMTELLFIVFPIMKTEVFLTSSIV